jgi:cobalt-zinc-cadmium efflux system outer membrane protein
LNSPFQIAARGLLVVALCVATSSVFAQPITLAQAIESAWQRAAESTATQGYLRRAQAEQATLTAWWPAPPSLELSQRMDRGLSGTGVRETEVGLAIPLWLPGQRAARQQLVAADTDVARAQEVAGRWLVAGLVRASQAEVHLRKAEVAQIQAEALAMQSLSRDVDRRVKAGDLAPADALAAQAEWLQADVRVANATEQLAQARLQWRSLTGLDEAPTLDDALALPADSASLLEVHPVLREASLRAEAARRKVDLVGASGRSAPEVVARIRRDVGGRGDERLNSWGIALRMPLGTDDRNQPLQAAALSERELAEAQLRQVKQQLDAAIEAQGLTQSALERQWRGEQQRAALLRERAKLISQSFSAGETALPDMLRALAAAHAAEAAARRLRIQQAQAAARLQHALGILP